MSNDRVKILVFWNKVLRNIWSHGRWRRETGCVFDRELSLLALYVCVFLIQCCWSDLLKIGRTWSGARGGAVGWDTALQAGRSRVRFPMVSLEFFFDIFPAALWPGVDSASNKWVPGIFPGGKGDRCVRLTTLPPSCADCLEIWEPQTSGTLRARPGL